MSKKPNGHAATAHLLSWLYAQGFSLPEALVLYEVARLNGASQPARMGDVARNLGMPLSTCSRIAWVLTESGWLDHRESERDRRVRELTVVTRLRTVAG